MIKKKLVVGACLVLTAFLMLPLKSANAQESTGLAVSPPSFELSANPGDVLKNSIRVDNLTDEAQQISVDKRNFTAIGEEGQVDLTEEDNGSFSLASWITVDPAATTIEAHKSVTFNYTINVPANAQPGGRFGSIVFKTAAKPLTGQSGVAVGQEIGALVFVKIAGEISEKGTILSFDTTKNLFETGPITFETRVKNGGNVFFRPSGTITITNFLGNKIASVPVDTRNVLPDAVRRMEGTWGNKWLFGKYTATVSLVYGSQNQLITASTTFWVIPYKLIILVLALLGGLGFLMYRGRERIKLALRALRGKE